MKEIKAIIQPFMLSKVMDSLRKLDNLPGITVSEVRGFGKSPAADAGEKVTDGSLEYVKKVKLEIVVQDDRVEELLRVIQEFAYTGNTGDGTIFLTGVDDVMKIRTGERGEPVL
ncbi:MAG: P-II family nitrogen regulator [Acidobacteria bacterium]|nr:P-II family nitrogen regulator [Acidobacteriota bacterium]